MMDFTRIEQCGIVPVIKIDDAGKAAPLAQALAQGGIDVMEITFRTTAAADAIREVARKSPATLVGAGTVITVKQLEQAAEAGAKFIVSPGLDEAVVKAALDLGLTVLPGVVTPSDIIRALNLGLTTVKFFPAESFGGASTVKSLAAPFTALSFVPTGGISEKNAADYWKLPCVKAVGGSWIAPDKLINDGNFDEIARLSKEAVELFKKTRG